MVIDNTTINRGAASEVDMRRRSDALARECAEQIRPLMPLARRAYGQQKQGSPARDASDQVNKLILAYDEEGGNITQLAEELEGALTLAGVRRRVRVARAGTALGVPQDRPFRGIRDPERVTKAAALIREAEGTPAYGQRVQDAYDQGIALRAIADELGVSYFTLWSSKSTSVTV